jgi:hypothetical protein
VGLVTDGAQYMKACFRDVIKPACVNCVHLICIAHCLNLVDEVLRKNVPRLDDFVAKMKTAFRLSAAKRRVYIQALVEAGVDDPLAPPSPVVTRWYSWLQGSSCSTTCSLFFKLWTDDAADTRRVWCMGYLNCIYVIMLCLFFL